MGIEGMGRGWTCTYVAFIYTKLSGPQKHTSKLHIIFDTTSSYSLLCTRLSSTIVVCIADVIIQIRDAMGNDYHKPKDVVGENRYAFTSHADSAFDVCFESIMTGGKTTNPRHVELDIDIGADAKDWNAVAAEDKLKPVEAELRRIEETVGEIVTEMDYLRAREQKLRDTNESTNERVKWFALGTMGVLMALGSWQVVYLRAYFRSKHLI
jgi:hypothetical protein